MPQILYRIHCKELKRVKEPERKREHTFPGKEGITTWGPFLICMELRGFQPLENVVFHLIFHFFLIFKD